jgi:GT2 family glycosyltransferase
MIEVIGASRLAEQEFWNRSALGISLRRLAHDTRLAAHVAFSNSAGLPEIYNARISADNRAQILLFVHDDVWIDDFFLADRVLAGLQAFDVIGVAGNRRRTPRQRAWRHVGAAVVADDPADLSGAIAHGKNPFGRVSFYGQAPAECELLDGVFIAARLSALLERSVRFDPIFDFHFYDLDFCRSARRAGLRLGTWPICLTHQSAGTAYESPPWMNAYDKYLHKWRE